MRYGYTETLVKMFCMSVYVLCNFIEMTRLCKFSNNLIEFGLQGKTIFPNVQETMTCIKSRVIPMVGPERDQDVVKQEASGSRSRGSYFLGRIQNRSSNPILRSFKTLGDI